MTKKWILGLLTAVCLIAFASYASAGMSFNGTYYGKLTSILTLAESNVTLSIQDNGGELTAWASIYNPRNGDMTLGIISNMRPDGNMLTFVVTYNGGLANGTFGEYSVELTGDKITGDMVNKIRGTKSKVALERVDTKACPLVARANNKIVFPC